MSSLRTMRCRECGRDTLDSRWSPLCPVCYESLHHQQRREQIRPSALDDSAWSDPAMLEKARAQTLRERRAPERSRIAA